MKSKLTEIYTIGSERVILDVEDPDGGVYLRAVEGSTTVEVFLDESAKRELIAALQGADE